MSAPAPLDPIPSLYAEVNAIRAYLNGPERAKDDAGEAALDRLSAVDRKTLAVKATTMAGAVASLEWARDELVANYIAEDDGDPGEQLILSLIDGALGVLRAITYLTTEACKPKVWGIGASDVRRLAEPHLPGRRQSPRSA